MSNLKIQNLKTDTLIPYARNAKKHDDAQVALIAGSIREFGFNVPVAVRGEPPTIVAGHGRVLAARKLGLAEVPCVRLDHLSDVQMRAYILADNKLAEKGGGWDEEMLRLEVEELAELDVDLGEIGFDADELSSEESLSEKYTQKVDAPIYEPKGEKPAIVELIDSKRAEDFLSKIEASKVSDDVKAFLNKAASRHLIFDYGKIAEFYCHADKETQGLMEDLALVIIDFNKAMQLGYVKLKAEIADALESEQGGASAEDDADE